MQGGIMAFITDPSFRRVTAVKVATLPSLAQNATGTADLFTVVGNVHLISIVGVLTASITGTGPSLRFGFLNSGTGDAAATDISAVTATVVGAVATALNSMVSLSDTRTGATRFISATGRAALDGPTNTRILRPGTVQFAVTNLTSDGSNGTLTGGQFTFHAIFEPHSPGAYMVPV